MRLDEIRWQETPYGTDYPQQALAMFPFNTDFQFWRNRDGVTYNVWFGSELRYHNLDALTAQAVLFDLCSRRGT